MSSKAKEKEDAEGQGLPDEGQEANEGQKDAKDEVIERLLSRVEALERAPKAMPGVGGIPRPQSAQELLRTVGPVGSAAGATTAYDPGAQYGLRLAFGIDQVVEVVDEEYVQRCRRAELYDEDEPVLGVITRFISRNREGTPKYRVEFKQGVGANSLLETQMKAYG